MAASAFVPAPDGVPACFTQEEIERLEFDGANLYRSVPGRLVPRTKEKTYLTTQLKRFIDSGASDLFVETQKAEGKIWFKLIFRIDGVQEIQDETQPRRPEDQSPENQNVFFQRVRKYLGAELSRINADMRHVMQDGSFTMEYRGRSRDFRVNALPCRVYGEPHPRYAVRLASEGDVIDFDKVDMLPAVRAEYGRMIRDKVAGCIIVTGPTGSGKTTTIYGMLNKIDKNANGIISIEKPIESQLRDVNQTEDDIREREDRRDSFGNKEFLRGVLRQAVDVIFVGEMRDSREIQEGIKVGLTGSKVITTLHTNNCVDTILRLKEEGLTNNAIANGVKFITAQRLVPALCPRCSVPHPDGAKLLEKIESAFRRPARHFSRRLGEALGGMETSDLADAREVAEALARSRALRASDDDLEGISSEVESLSGELAAIPSKEGRVARIVEACAGKFPNRGAMAEFTSRLGAADLRVANPEGCAACRRGYAGRLGAFEVLRIDRSVRQFVQDPDNRLVDLEDYLQDKGFLDMRRYGWLLALAGRVSAQDVATAVE